VIAVEALECFTVNSDFAQNLIHAFKTKCRAPR
jgi:hypothetical protein